MFGSISMPGIDPGDEAEFSFPDVTIRIFFIIFTRDLFHFINLLKEPAFGFVNPNYLYLFALS